MATPIEFIYKILGADKARRDIDKVHDAVDQTQKKADAKDTGGQGFLARLGKEFDQLQKQVPVLGKVALGVGSLAAAWRGATAAVSAYAAQERKFVQLEAALSRQGVLTRQYRDELAGLASQFQDTTGVADD